MRWPKPLKWQAVERRIVAIPSLVLCLDYDGTLVPITAHPSQATIPKAIQRLLAQLARLPDVWIVVISGRSLQDLKRRVGVRGVWYVGNHGLELETLHRRYIHRDALTGRSFLARVGRDLKTVVRQIPGAWVEDKRFTLTLHWRGVVPAVHRRLHRLVTDVTEPYAVQGLIRVTRGKRVTEIRPSVRWGKGEVIAWLQHPQGLLENGARLLFIYIGDDQTDEDAFRMINRARGFSVFVGPRRRASAGHWWVKSPRNVQQFLTRILRTRWKINQTRSPRHAQ